MKVKELFEEYEIVFVDENGNIIEEGAIQQYKRVGQKLVKKYRCLSGKKKGKLVSHPSKCAQRKEPRRVRIGRRVMRTKKGVILRKSLISKRKTLSKLVKRLNKRLRGSK